MNIFIILYLIVIIAALMLILSLLKRKEKFSSQFSMQCRWKDAESREILPNLYVYYDDSSCEPSQNFKNKIITQEIKNMFAEVYFIDLHNYINSEEMFPYVKDKIEYTPSIIIEYPYVIEPDKIQDIIKAGGIKVDGQDDKYIIVIDNLDYYTPNDDRESGNVLEVRKSSFKSLMESMIII